MSQTSKLRTMLVCGMLALSLAACAPTRNAPTAAAPSSTSPNSDTAARRAEIQRQLRPLCGTPTNWTAAQKRAVADFIDKHAAELGLQLLAGEWDRTNQAIRICRGDAAIAAS